MNKLLLVGTPKVLSFISPHLLWLAQGRLDPGKVKTQTTFKTKYPLFKFERT